MELTNNMEQGNIKALFPNLGKTVWKDGQYCEIIGCNNQEVQLRTLTEGGHKKVGVVFWTDCFLVAAENSYSVVEKAIDDTFNHVHYSHLHPDVVTPMEHNSWKKQWMKENLTHEA